MEAIKLTTAESEAVERAYYEASSFEALMAVLCRQLNVDPHRQYLYRRFYREVLPDVRMVAHD